MVTTGPMLHDLRSTYIKRDEPSFLGRAAPALKENAVLCLAVATLLGMAWASLKYGVALQTDPTTYFPYITPVVE